MEQQADAQKRFQLLGGHSDDNAWKVTALGLPHGWKNPIFSSNSFKEYLQMHDTAMQFGTLF